MRWFCCQKICDAERLLRERATMEAHIFFKIKLISCYTCVYNRSLGSALPTCLFYEELCEFIATKLPPNLEEGTTSLNVGNATKLPEGSPRWAPGPALPGTPAAVKGDPLFLKKWLVKAPTSHQLSEYLCSRNTNDIVWVNSLLWWIRGKASLTLVMGTLILLGWGDREAYSDPVSACDLCHKIHAAPVNWRRLQWLGHRCGENTARTPAWSSEGIARRAVTCLWPTTLIWDGTEPTHCSLSFWGVTGTRNPCGWNTKTRSWNARYTFVRCLQESGFKVGLSGSFLHFLVVHWEQS